MFNNISEKRNRLLIRLYTTLRLSGNKNLNLWHFNFNKFGLWFQSFSSVWEHTCEYLTFLKRKLCLRWFWTVNCSVIWSKQFQIIELLLNTNADLIYEFTFLTPFGNYRFLWEQNQDKSENCVYYFDVIKLYISRQKLSRWN